MIKMSSATVGLLSESKSRTNSSMSTRNFYTSRCGGPDNPKIAWALRGVGSLDTWEYHPFTTQKPKFSRVCAKRVKSIRSWCQAEY